MKHTKYKNTIRIMLLSVIASVKGGHSGMYNIIPAPIYSYPHCWKPRSPSEIKEKGVNSLRSYLQYMRNLGKRHPVSNPNDSTCSTLSGANLGAESSSCSSDQISLFSDTSSLDYSSSSNGSESNGDVPKSLLKLSLKGILAYFGAPKVSSCTNNYI